MFAECEFAELTSIEYTSLDVDEYAQVPVDHPEDSLGLVYQILKLSDREILTILDCIVKAKPYLRKNLNELFSNKRMRANELLRESSDWQVRELRQISGGQLPKIGAPPAITQQGNNCKRAMALPPPGKEPAVQFSCRQYFVSETEDKCEIQVMRIGNLDYQARVAYRTQDGSAVAGAAYSASEGFLEFAPGESWKTLAVAVYNNDEWDTTVTFTIELLEQGTSGALLSGSQCKTTVSIVNDDAFPTNKYADEIQEGGEDIEPLGLLMEYMKLQWNFLPIRNGTKKLFLVGLYHNLFFILKLFMNLFLLKSVLVAATTDEQLLYKRKCLVAIALLTFFPFIGSHFLEYYKYNWKVGGMSRALLQKALLRKYMTCDAASRFVLRDGIMIMAVARDCQDLMANGYMGTVTLITTTSHLFMLCLFQFLAPYVFKLPPRLTAFVPMVIFPLVLIVGMTMRNKKSIDILFRRNNLQVDLVDSVVETTKDYQLIIDYECRGKFISRFEDGVTKYNAADMSALKLLVNNSYFTPWITTIFVAGYTYVGGQEVIAGSLSLAMYLTNIAVFTQMGAAYNQILNMCVTIQTAFPALLRITRLLNLPSDDNTRMGWTRFQSENSRNIALQSGELKRQGLDTTGIPEFDLLPIRVRDLKLVHYHLVDQGVTSDPSDDVDTSFQFYGNVELKQGSLISLIGPHSGGKSTLLRVLGGTLLPHLEMVNAGQLFLPCHLRVIHVPSESMFFRGTMLENLTFGCDEDSVSGNDASKERVEAILRMLGLPDCVIDLMDENNMHGLHWLEVVCLSQRFLLAVARALIANPELLCVHKPTEKFSAAEGKRVLSVLKTFVKERGVKKGPPDIGTRPRTCIMTNVSVVAKDYADDMIHVSRDSLKRVDESMRKSENLHNLMVG